MRSPSSKDLPKISVFLLQSIFGLDHYPNYLHKWNVSDIEHLETLLQEQVAKVKEGKSKVLARNELLKLYAPVYPDFWSIVDSQPELLLKGDLLKALDEAERGNLETLDSLVEDTVPFAYKIPLLHPEVCDKLLSEVKNFLEFSCEHEQKLQSAGWLNRRHCALGYMKLQNVEDVLLNRVMKTVVPLVYPLLADFPLDFRYGYVISYGSEQCDGSTKRRGLTPHTDDSEVTLNCCLGGGFEGGRVVFRNLRNSGKDGRKEGAIRPHKGYALIHLGQHLHEVEDVSSGNRDALILWTRSSALREQTCPCCLLHRREGCICDPSWN
eukprot:gb/GECG01009520.1/.p1 GENE.gb/GECG01009520.1/~~gb/GECG01009520.1/.p1  ORF type:complete len:324 (+),score=37.61 gb/GECG01009520.1/:1-972(+)